MIAITGANGFIGRHLLRSLIESRPGHELRALTRLPEPALELPGVTQVQGDIADPRVWDQLLEPDCTLINLAYPHPLSEADAHALATSMLDACERIAIRRLIHCSTVSVYGRVEEDQVTEESACHPFSSYGNSKLAIEQQLLECEKKIELVILRPTNVFGYGGQALVKPILDLTNGNRLVNYLRSMLFGRRSTHLVPVETVAAALSFLCSTNKAINNDIFIVSDDENPLNNYCEVERILMEELGVSPFGSHPPALPHVLLETLLWARGRPNVRSRTKYHCEKLMNWGFVKPVPFETALRRFASQHRVSTGLGIQA